jgi:hypothetical protein
MSSRKPRALSRSKTSREFVRQKGKWEDTRTRRLDALVTVSRIRSRPGASSIGSITATVSEGRRAAAPHPEALRVGSRPRGRLPPGSAGRGGPRIPHLIERGPGPGRHVHLVAHQGGRLRCVQAESRASARRASSAAVKIRSRSSSVGSRYIYVAGAPTGTCWVMKCGPPPPKQRVSPGTARTSRCGKSFVIRSSACSSSCRSAMGTTTPPFGR